MNSKLKCFLFIINYFLLLLPQNTIAGGDSTTFNKKRFVPLITTVGVAYGGALIGLNELWYKGYPKSKFHFFNDNHQWQQIDKFGHGLTAFHESRLGVDLLKWSGVSDKKAIIYGSLTGFIFQTPIELFDGLSSEYGASAGDLLANTAGSAFVLSQYLLWNELRIYFKYSFHQTSLASLRPATLGSSLIENTLKDYNGQTYWMCTNIASFLKSGNKFPKWLNLAIGYGGENMLYGTEAENTANGYSQYRQYYLSFDIDLQKIKTKSSVLKKVFYTLNVIHLPAPAIEFNKNKLRFHPFYF